jgi:hypothetical protein
VCKREAVSVLAPTAIAEREKNSDFFNVLPLPTMNRYLQCDSTMYQSKRKVHKEHIKEIINKHDLITYLHSIVALNGGKLEPGEKIVTPNLYDVLFPINGMMHWPGNERFGAMIESRRLEFLSSPKRCSQLRVALEMIEEISIGRKESFSRFLYKPSSADLGKASHPWEVMDLESILVELGKAFRSEKLYDDGKEPSHKNLTTVDSENTDENSNEESESTANKSLIGKMTKLS